MKKYVKLFEEFYAEEFLEDFGIEVFSFKNIKKVLDTFEDRGTDFMRIIYSSDEVDIGKNDLGMDYVKLVGTSKYDLTKWTRRGSYPKVTELINLGKTDYINVIWNIEFVRDNSPFAKVGIMSNINANCTYSIKKDFNFKKKYFSSYWSKKKDNMNEDITKHLYLLSSAITRPIFKIHNAIYGNDLIMSLNNLL